MRRSPARATSRSGCCRCVRSTASPEIPVYVDAAPAGRTELTWCASSAADMTVTRVGLTLQRTLTTPVVAGAYAWQARFDNTVDSRSALGVASATPLAQLSSRAGTSLPPWPASARALHPIAYGRSGP